MPYSSNDELPEAVQKRYTDRCQTVFRKAHDAHDGDEGSKMAVAHTAAMKCMDATKMQGPMKATLLDEDHFRLLAIPFGGPIGGRDLDGQFFSAKTNIHPGLIEARLVDWHHGKDPLMGRTVLGKAVLDDEPEEDGWWVDVWLNHGEKRLALVRRLAEKAPIFGSSEALWSKASPDGEILDWPYWRQTLSTSPQNTLSVVRPAMKATLDDFATAGIAVDDHLRAFIGDLDDLGVDLRSTSLGEDAAKAGRVLSARNETRLREAIAALTDALSELEKYTQSERDTHE